MTDTVEQLQSKIRTLEAELTVVSFERDQLLNQWDAVRVFFGGTKVGDTLDRYADPSTAGRALLIDEVAEILIRYIFPGKKIQAIKEMRTLTNYGLKEAKDLIDAADNRAIPVYQGQPIDLYELTKQVNANGVIG